MGVFFNRYNPNIPGPGVNKNAPKKPKIIEFFIMYSNRFYKLVLLNIMYFLFSIPAILAAQYLSYNVFRFFDRNTYNDIQNWLAFSLIIICIPVIAIGPVQAGFTYVLRKFVQGDHAFIWQDFKDSASRNFKQSMIISGINLLVFFVFSTSIGWYLAFGQKTLLMSVIVGLQAFMLIIFLMVNLYTYPLLVTFELKVIEIYKNALLFTLLKFVPNILIMLLCVVLSTALMFNFIIGFVLMPFFTLSTVGFIINFYVYPSMKKYLIDRVSTTTQS
jgi:uncharacterized membrane protein YesL